MEGRLDVGLVVLRLPPIWHTGNIKI